MKVEASDPFISRQLQQRGARLLADYGSYELLEVNNPGQLVVAQAGARVRPEYNFLRLNTGEIDTSSAALRTERKTVGAFSGKRLHLVHFAGPPKSEWVQELCNSGLRIISYIPHNAYLVYGDAPALGNLQAMAARKAHIQWDGTYGSTHKIQPGTLSQQARLRAGTTAIDTYAVQLVDDADANRTTLSLLDKHSLDSPSRRTRTLGFLNIVIRLPAAAVTQLAGQPDVVSVRLYQPKSLNCERQAQIISGNLNGNLPAGPGYLEWLTAKGFTPEQFESSGFVVDVADSGLDNGTTLPNHFGLYTGGETTNTSRVAYVRLEGSPNVGSSIQGCDGHGTLNSHIIGGYDYRNGFPLSDSAGYHYGLGICPFVKVGNSVIFDPARFTSPIYDDMLSRAYQSGARITSNSWGDDTGDGGYDIDAQEYDALVRDAQPGNSAFPASGNQEMVVVFAAGNDGFLGSTTIGAPATAKNVICVGASENVQPIGGTDSSGVADTEANSANDVPSFSSRGPCVDGRQKPDVVAPGTHVSGGVIQSAEPGADGLADLCFTGDGVSGGPGGSDFFPLGQQFFTASSGTSHSAPAVAGAAALLRQWFINQGSLPPTPAMTKALLVNSSRHLIGTGANDNYWSPRQGMGLIDLGRAFDDSSRVLRDQLEDDTFNASGQSRTYTASVQNSSEPLRITLAWTDAPGSTVGSAYNNDLDLVVTAGGTSYFGNVFSGAFSVTGGAPDFKNNVESVLLPAGSAGQVTIQVVATSINSDGVPNNAQLMDQDFALVVYNAQLVAMPSIRQAGYELLSEGCIPTNGIFDPGEILTVSLGLKNAGTLGTTNLSATLVSTGGVLAVTASQDYGIIPVGGIVAKPFSFILNRDCGDIVTAQLLLKDGEADLGQVDYTFSLGKVVSITNYAENFDAFAPPIMPQGWLPASTGEGIVPILNSSIADSLPNSVYLAEPDVPGTSELTSPWIAVSTHESQLFFNHSYDTEVDPYASMIGYDGSVLEIQIGTNDFADILAAGGTFVLGGYTREIDLSASSGIPNPLGGRMGWCGNSGGFTQTIVKFPITAAGNNIRLRWRLATDTGNFYGGNGWYIDSVYLSDGSYSCCTATPPVFDARVISTGPTVLVQVQTTSDYQYVLEYKEELLDENWTSILPPAQGTGDTMILEDPVAGSFKRFYRVRAFRP